MARLNQVGWWDARLSVTPGRMRPGTHDAPAVRGRRSESVRPPARHGGAAIRTRRAQSPHPGARIGRWSNRAAAPILRPVKLRRPRTSLNPDRLGLWIWGAVGVLVLVALIAVVASSGGDDSSDATDPFDVTATVISHLGAYGSPDGEGLSRAELGAAVGRTNTADGTGRVPQATIDGPGRRLFAGVTVRLPRGRQPFVLRQVVPGDLPGANAAPAFVQWDGWVAVLTPTQIRAGAGATDLAWRKAGAGLEVPAGSTVRLRTLFRIVGSAGRCSGPALPAGSDGHRAQESLRGAPAWLIRRPGRDTQWQWLRAETQDSTRLPVAVRSGPPRPVLFRGSSVCRTQQSAVSVNPDLSSSAGVAQRGLPFDTPNGY